MKLTESKKEEFGVNENFLLAFEGLGLLHRGETYWRSWFPTIKDHELTLIIEKNKAPLTKFLIPSGCRIEIAFEIEEQRDDDGLFATSILNVNRRELHYGGLKVSNNNNDEINRLKFPRNVNLFPSGEGNTFDVWKCEPSGNRKEKTAAVTIRERVASFIQCRLGTQMRISIRDQVYADFILKFDETSKYLVTFNNRCESLGCSTSSDYHFYYTLIDLPAYEDKFELIPVPHIDPIKAPAPMCDIVHGDRLDYKPW